jgi:deazaflavin-dependent oxidoreductase (nitroreductase family)
MSVLSRLPGLPRHLNPKLTPLARRLPPLAVLHHQGRRTSRSYDTPVQAFRTQTGFIVGLAYNSQADWALNILTAGQAEITRGGRRYALSKPRRRGPEAGKDLAAPVALMMRILGIDEFLEFDATQLSPPARH